MSELSDALDAYRSASYELQDLYIERAEVRAAEVESRVSAYATLNDGTRTVTQVREEADHAASTMKRDAIKLDGDIDAILARLRWLDLWISHLRTDIQEEPRTFLRGEGEGLVG